jgi:antitoxin YefM
VKAVNYSELRQNLKANLDAVSDYEELLIVQRPKGKSIIMMSLAEYNAMKETMYLNKSKANRERLENAIDNINTKTNLIKQNLAE